MITLILNTRGRPDLLVEMINSFVDNAYDINNFRFAIWVDEDDLATITKLEGLNTAANIYVVIGQRPKNLHSTLNSLAKSFGSDYIFVLNDDVKMLTKDWDTKITVDQNEIIYLYTHDNSADKESTAEYASFPILTRAAYEALGYFMSEAFVGLGADVHLWRVFKALNRIKAVDIELDHVYHKTVELVRSPDRTAIEMRQNSWRSNFDCWNIDISSDVERVKNEIESRLL